MCGVQEACHILLIFIHFIIIIKLCRSGLPRFITLKKQFAGKTGYPLILYFLDYDLRKKYRNDSKLQKEK